MARNVARVGIFSVLVLTLAACSSSDSDKATTVNPNIYPAQYKQEIIATLHALFTKNGTATVSNAMISPPVLTTVGKDRLYTLCVRYTAHGTSPGIIGNATRLAYFYGGQLNQLVPVTGDECAGVAYQPFLELDRICLGSACQNSQETGHSGFMGLF